MLRFLRPHTIAYGLLVIAAFAFALAQPRSLWAGVIVALGAACLGALAVPQATWHDVLRSALLTGSAFGYPLFVGMAPCVIALVAVHVALLIASWTPWRTHVAWCSTLASVLALSMAAQAAQFLFPWQWHWSVMGFIASTFLLLVLAVRTSVPTIPMVMVGVGALVLSEGALVLRQLPFSWIVSGPLLAITFALVLERERVPQTVLASLLFGLFALGFHA